MLSHDDALPVASLTGVRFQSCLFVCLFVCLGTAADFISGLLWHTKKCQQGHSLILLFICRLAVFQKAVDEGAK